MAVKKRKTTMADILGTLYVVSNENHPHYGCTGYLTTNVIDFNDGKGPMAKMQVDNCKHLTTGWFVGPKDVKPV